MFKLTVNGGVDELGVFNAAKMIDSATAVQTLSPKGQVSVGAGETTQFSGVLKGWAGEIQKEEVAIESALGAIIAQFTVDGASASVAIGDGVSITGTGSVTRAVLAALALSGAVLGVATSAGAPGVTISVQVDGELPPAISGVSSFGPVRCNTTTGRLEVVANFAANDYPVGFSTSSGWVTMVRGVVLSGGNSPSSGTGLGKYSAGVAIGAASLLVDADVNAAAAIAGTKVAPSFGSQNGATTGGWQLGTSPAAASAGILSLPINGGVNFKTGGSDFVGLTWNGSNLLVGDGTQPTLINGSTGLTVFAATVEKFRVDTTGARSSVPFAGNKNTSTPFTRARVVHAMVSDADFTAIAAEYECPIIELTGGATLTATRKIILPVASGASYSIFNNTTGAQAITAIGATGAGITIATGKRARVYSDGTNYVRETADV